MLYHIEQLLALISLENNLDHERLDGKPENLEDLNNTERFYKEMEDGIIFMVVPDAENEVFHIYEEDGTPIVSVKYDDFELAYEELEIYADEHQVA